MRINTRLLLVSSAMFMGGLSLPMLFAPAEILPLLGQPATPFAVLLCQLVAALYLGFAVLNYMARGVLVGGIYARPLAMGNYAHFFAGAFILLQAARYRGPVGSFSWPDPITYILWALLTVYALFGILFYVVFSTHPGK